MDTERCRVRKRTSIIFIDLETLKTRRMRVRRTTRTTPNIFCRSPLFPPITTVRIWMMYQGRMAIRSTRLSGCQKKAQYGITVVHVSERSAYSTEKIMMQTSSTICDASCISMRCWLHVRVATPVYLQPLGGRVAPLPSGHDHWQPSVA